MSAGEVYPGTRLLRGHSSLRPNNWLVYLLDFSHSSGEWKLTPRGVSGKVGIEHSQGLQLNKLSAINTFEGFHQAVMGILRTKLITDRVHRTGFIHLGLRRLVRASVIGEA